LAQISIVKKKIFVTSQTISPATITVAKETVAIT